MLSQLSNLLGLGLSVTAPDTRPGQKPAVDFATLFAETEAEEHPQTRQADLLPDVDDSAEAVADDTTDADDPAEKITGDRSPRTETEPETPDIDFPRGPKSRSDVPDPTTAVTEESLVFPRPVEGPDPQVDRRPDPKLTASSLGAMEVMAPNRIPERAGDADPPELAASGILRPDIHAVSAAPTALSRPVDVMTARAPKPAAHSPALAEVDARLDVGAVSGAPPSTPAQGRVNPTPGAPPKIQVAATMRSQIPIETMTEPAVAERPTVSPASPVQHPTGSSTKPVMVVSKGRVPGPDMPIFHMKERGLTAHAASSAKGVVGLQTDAQAGTSGLVTRRLPGVAANFETSGSAAHVPDDVISTMASRTSVQPMAPRPVAGVSVAPGAAVLSKAMVGGPMDSGQLADPVPPDMLVEPAGGGPVTKPLSTSSATVPPSNEIVTRPVSTGVMTESLGSGAVTEPARKGTVNKPVSTGVMMETLGSGAVTEPARKGTVNKPVSTGAMMETLGSGAVTEPSSKRAVSRPVNKGAVIEPVGMGAVIKALSSSEPQGTGTKFVRETHADLDLGADLGRSPKPLMGEVRTVPQERSDRLLVSQRVHDLPAANVTDSDSVFAGPVQQRITPLATGDQDAPMVSSQGPGLRVEDGARVLRAQIPVQPGVEQGDTLPDAVLASEIAPRMARSTDVTPALAGSGASPTAVSGTAQATVPAPPLAFQDSFQPRIPRPDRDTRFEHRGDTATPRVAPAEASPPKSGPIQALSAPVPGPSPALDRAQASRVTSPFLADVVEETELAGPWTGHGGPELRAHLQGPAVHPAVITRTDPQPVLRQIVDGVARMRDGGVELQLSPEELGRVRMQLVPGEAGLVVHITADRPETLDLMRRNIDQLARDLADSGYGGAEFTFGDSGGGNDDRTPRGSPGAVAQAPAERDMPERAAASPVIDGLDIRL